MEDNLDMEYLLELVETRQFRKLKELLIEINEVGVAFFMEELDLGKTMVVFRMLPKRLATDVPACLSLESQRYIINSITDVELRGIIEDLLVGDAVNILEELPVSVMKRMFQNVSPDTRKLTNQFLQYSKGSAGSIMAAEYVGLRRIMTVEETFAYIRKHGVDKETIHTCYMMDGVGRSGGVVTVKDLLMDPYDTRIEDIMDTHVIRAATTEDQEDMVESFHEYDLLNLLVMDHEE